ncbi:pilus assembly protein PilB [Actinoplanes lobatus]|uniref:Pilus assembly protein PilB n=1 Tax=Actinoplanes lobatus TaxID=113568 RepID=A0A7W7H9A4_9ACTN|nr:GspE/PulE family protein [Actinoplanes lobatus]MBB4746228.1 type IV pilus assembly protein PilB [Actinoplanes lobatus]GGN61223.1 pilus assembly protein PilB [Actinoplanes lobatus]GIE41436.1 pilus assembly protein PilB [Actinoplanes lobatus]
MRLRNRAEQAGTEPRAAVLLPEPIRPTDLSIVNGGRRLGELLLYAGLVQHAQVLAALSAAQRGTGKRLGQLLVESGAVSDRDIARAVAHQHGLPVVDLRQVVPEESAVALLDEASARELLAIPVTLQDAEVAVVVALPSEAVRQALAQAIGRAVTLGVAPESEIMRAIGNGYRALTGVDVHVKAFEAREIGRRDVARAASPAAHEDAPVVQVVQMILTQALRDRASDVHIEPQSERIRVRFRIDGALHDMLDLPGSMGSALVSRIKILGGMNIVERRRPQDGQISTEVEGVAVDIRVSTTAVVGGEKVVMRLLDKSRPLYELATLGMSPQMTDRYSALLRAPYGMVICAGPTGSGKTTTLYGSLNEINSPERNIMTIEDPVEYTFPSINQIQINEAAGLTFADGLRSILRQDPDVILVGEIRDVETARIAVQSALTGHFVLSSLHATDAVSALHRLLDMGIENFLVASSVTAMVAQRLVRRICRHCTEHYQPSQQELALIAAIGGRPPQGGFVRGAGCNFCAHTGFLDRVGVYEMMPVSEAIRAQILASAGHDEIRQTARREGMRTLQEEAARLVSDGVTTPAEILRSIYVPGS